VIDFLLEITLKGIAFKNQDAIGMAQTSPFINLGR